jgi:hypothetical protein
MRRGKSLSARDETWITSWLDSVRDGRASMSQLARSSVDMRGGLDVVRRAVKKRRVHLVELTDDKGGKRSRSESEVDAGTEVIDKTPKPSTNWL